MISIALAGCLLAAGGQTLTLGQAQALLLAQSPEIRLGQLDADKARAQVSEAQAAYWPSLDVSATYQAFTEAQELNIALPPPVGNIHRTLGDKDREEYGVDLSYALVEGGQRRQRALARKSSLQAAEEEVRARRNQLSLRLATLFYAWQAADTTARAQTRIAGLYGDYAAGVSDQLKQGAVLKSRQLVARARWLDAQADQQNALYARDSIGRAAALLLGLPPDQNLAFTGDVAPDSLPSPANSGTRPELERLDRVSEALRHQDQATAAQHLPTLSGFVGYRVANPGLNLGSDEYMNYGLVGLQLKWNLFDGFRSRSQRAEIRSQQEAIQVQKIRETAFWDEAALSADRRLERLELSLEAARAARDGAREATREKEAQGRQGAASDLDRIDARVDEARADVRLRSLELQWKLAQWQKRFAHGETLAFPTGG